MLFLVLGVIQLAMLQHARLMTEYAAYNAVRAGTVWNGDQCMMRQAALISLLPTLEATDTLTGPDGPPFEGRRGLIQTWAKWQLVLTGTDMLATILDWSGLGDPGVRLIDVEILNPTEDDLDLFVSDGEGEQELNFDVIAGVPDGDDFSGEGRMRQATVLTARVTFLYPMRIPFANWTIFYGFLASRAGLSARGAFFKPGVEPNSIVSGSDVSVNVSGSGLVLMGDDLEGLADGDEDVVASTTLMLLLWQIGQQTDWYLFPLHAVHSMRMQSNFYADSFESSDVCL